MGGAFVPSRVRLFGIAGVLSLVAVAGVLGVLSGSTIDNDTYALEETFDALGRGHYEPSRTSGYPAYEFLGTATSMLGGRTLTMALSCILTLAALLLLVRPTRAHVTWLGFACWAALSLSPLVLTNASAIMETSALLLAIALLCWTLCRSAEAPARLSVLFVVAALVVLTRPDALLLIVATIGAALLGGGARDARIKPALALGGGLAAGLIALVVITQRLPFAASYLPDESPVRRVLRGVIGFSTVLGVVGAAALAFLVVAVLVTLWRRRGSAPSTGGRGLLDDRRFVAWWLLLTTALYTLRFLGLSDELEYLLPLLIVLAVAIPNLRSLGPAVVTTGVIALMSTAATSLVVLSFLGRANPWQVDPGIRITVNEGGFLQDLHARQAHTIRATPGYQDFIAQSVREYRSALDAKTSVLMPRNSWHFIVNAGYREYYTGFDTVISCDELTTETLIPGWRVSQPGGSFGDLTAYHASQPLDCRPVATLKDGVVTPIEGQ